MNRLLLFVCLTLMPVVATFAQKVTAVTEEYPPYNFTDANQKITGFSTEVVTEVLRRAKIDFQIKMFPWARAYRIAQADTNVLIYSIGRTQERESLFKWVDMIAAYNVYLYRLKSRADIKVSDLASVRKLKVGAVRDDVDAQYLAKEGIRPELVADNGFNAKKLAAGRIDLFPMDELALVALYQREGLDVTSVEKTIKLDALSSGLYMAFSLQTSDDIVNRCKKALQEMKKDGTIDKIKVAYLQ